MLTARPLRPWMPRQRWPRRSQTSRGSQRFLGSDARSTAERLRSLDRSAPVDAALAQDLATAFDWVSRQILRASLARPGCPQHLHAVDLDPSDRAHYRDAAAVVQEARATLVRLTGDDPIRRNR